jgi:ketosteroid isomerase-like protein
MKLRWMVASGILVLVLSATGAAAQGEKKAAPAKAAKSTTGLVALLQKITEAWSSTDASGVAQYYAQEPGHVYYDITPMKYNGWQEYAAGYNKLMANYSSVKFILGPDAQAHQHGNLAWSTTTWRAELVKGGTKETLEGRWTAIFERRGDKWIIVHDHFSVPLPPPAPGPEKK